MYMKYVFLTPTGKQVTHISEELRLLSKEFPMELGEIRMTATAMRKLSATEVAKTSDSGTVQSVASHMTHSANTADRFYHHIQGVSNSIAAYDVLMKKCPREDADEDLELEPLPKKTTRRKWLPEEESILNNEFSLEANMPPPSLEDCFLILNTHQASGLFMGRSSKNIQDKCRPIIRKKNK